jgi:hypothetical protein
MRRDTTSQFPPSSSSQLGQPSIQGQDNTSGANDSSVNSSGANSSGANDSGPDGTNSSVPATRPTPLSVLRRTKEVIRPHYGRSGLLAGTSLHMAARDDHLWNRTKDHLAQTKGYANYEDMEHNNIVNDYFSATEFVNSADPYVPYTKELIAYYKTNGPSPPVVPDSLIQDPDQRVVIEEFATLLANPDPAILVEVEAMKERLRELKEESQSTQLDQQSTLQPEQQSASNTTNVGNNPAKPPWFRELFGFDESDNWDENVQHFRMERDTLVCDSAPGSYKRQLVGAFECKSLTDLRNDLLAKRQIVEQLLPKVGGLSFTHLAAPGGVGPLLRDPNNARAIFQVASQFNCLEMKDPTISPKDGIAIYTNDKTQGPACALVCPAATVYRNYLVEHDGNTGQYPTQIDNLSGVGQIVKNDTNKYWTMNNGYALPTSSSKFAELARRFTTETNLAKEAEDALRVGIHWGTSLNPRHNRNHIVCQVFASALPCAYDRTTPPKDWEPFARLVLRAAYDATLAAAAIRACIEPVERVNCYLTSLGGHAFGNDRKWICDAIKDSLDKYESYPIDVFLVHFASGFDSNWNTDIPPRPLAQIQSMPQQGQQSTPQSRQQSMPQPDQQSTQGIQSQPVSQPRQQSTPQPRQQSTPQLGQQSTPQQGQQSTPQPGQQSMPQQGQQSTPQPGQQSTQTQSSKQKQKYDELKLTLDRYTPLNITWRSVGQFIPDPDVNSATRETKRVNILIDTLNQFENNRTTFYRSARSNMLKWCKYLVDRPNAGLDVIVEPIDWGVMALKCTKQYNTIFACLNMANEYTPGGAYQLGPSAQEENMFRRTDIHFFIDRRMLAFNTNTRSYKYKQTMSELIGAKSGTTYLDTTDPRICIKGNEDYDLPNLGYADLAPDEMFLFYELRCAAKKFENGAVFDEPEMDKRIHAQFKTLKNNRIRHAILGAFGCGAFKNDPAVVSTLYKKYLTQYRSDFDVIAFPIFYAGSGDMNYGVFKKTLLEVDENSRETMKVY